MPHPRLVREWGFLHHLSMGSAPTVTAGPSSSLVDLRQLLQVVDQIQIGKSAAIFVDVIVAVGRDEDGADVRDAGDI